MTQIALNQEIDELTALLAKMCRQTEEMTENAVLALRRADRELAATVAASDSAIDELQLEIERKGLKFILKRQPVARDFRFVSAVLHVITDVERIGDQSEDIANLVADLHHSYDSCCKVLPEMCDLAVGMVTSAFNAFLRNDAEMAESVIATDDRMDELFAIMRQEAAEIIRGGGERTEDVPILLMIAKYCERLGDHAVNVAEWTEYNKSGVLKK